MVSRTLSIDDIEERVRDSAERALRVIAEDLLGRAVADAPVEEGTLRGSGITNPSMGVNRTLTGASITVEFHTPYAAKQEVERSYKHPLGGKAGYLGDNLLAMAPRYRAVMEASFRQAIT